MVVLPMSMRSRSLSNSLRWVWSVPANLVQATNHSGCHGLGCCVGRLAAPMTVSNGGSALLPVSHQDAPGVAWVDTQQSGGLIQCLVLRDRGVQNP